jgi:hypothetical protein
MRFLREPGSHKPLPIFCLLKRLLLRVRFYPRSLYLPYFLLNRSLGRSCIKPVEHIVVNVGWVIVWVGLLVVRGFLRDLLWFELLVGELADSYYKWRRAQ